MPLGSTRNFLYTKPFKFISRHIHFQSSYIDNCDCYYYCNFILLILSNKTNTSNNIFKNLTYVTSDWGKKCLKHLGFLCLPITNGFNLSVPVIFVHSNKEILSFNNLYPFRTFLHTVLLGINLKKYSSFVSIINIFWPIFQNFSFNIIQKLIRNYSK